MTRQLLNIAALVLTSCALCDTSQNPESLRARAKAEGGSVTMFMGIDFSMFSFEELVKTAEVIVHGRVRSVRPHLTADESDVVTDVTIDPTRLLKQTTPVVSRAQPGATAPLIVRHVGGTVVEQGMKISLTVDVYPSIEEFTAGDEVVCFLVYDASQGVFQLVDGPSGAFRVRQGNVYALTKDAGLRLRHEPTPVAAFLSSIDQSLGRERRHPLAR
jgi:hypothetical protein